MSVKETLIAIAGAANVSDTPDVLERFAGDLSFVDPATPGWVVSVSTTEEIQQIVKYAAGQNIPVTPRSSGIGFYGAGIPVAGGIVIEMTAMNRILEIDPDNKRIMIEPGVTYGQLQPVLAEKGLQVCNPLLAHPQKSVLTSSLERDPILIPKPEYNETLCTFNIVTGNGDIIRTGSALGTGITSGIYPDGLYPGVAMYKGAQGTLGILTWANIKVEWLPALDKTVCIAFDSPDEIADPLYAIQRRQIGRECLVLDRFNLAAALAPETGASIAEWAQKFPPYVMIVCLSGGDILPEEKIAYEEEALLDIANHMQLRVLNDAECEMLQTGQMPALLRKPWDREGNFWKQRPKGSCHDIFFHAPIEKVAAFTALMSDTAADHGYAAEEIGFYLQSVEYGRVGFYQYSFHSNPHIDGETGRVRAIFNEASQKAMETGAFFSSPYGAWSQMVYERAGAYPQILKIVKDAFDPNGIMNPGRICF